MSYSGCVCEKLRSKCNNCESNIRFKTCRQLKCMQATTVVCKKISHIFRNICVKATNDWDLKVCHPVTHVKEVDIQYSFRNRYMPLIKRWPDTQRDCFTRDVANTASFIALTDFLCSPKSRERPKWRFTNAFFLWNALTQLAIYARGVCLLSQITKATFIYF